ncbi:MAG: LON peptidase substrate-binding domain-containing protein, partial [Burkholderiales bacterium]|nr:LON peptidase substrate-binding domain-containing protein [Burkholderiales bacterium]
MRPIELPLFPLTTVLFPGGVLPLKIFEQRYMDMTKRCLQDDSQFGVCLIKEGAEVGAVAVPHTIGTLARIANWDMPQLGVLNVRAIGVQRFQVLDYKTQEDGLLLAQAIRLPLEPTTPLPPEHAACAAVLKHIIAHVGEEKFEPPFDFDDGVWTSYRLAEIMPIKATAKQDMLEMNDTLIRLDVLHKFLAQQGLAT